MMLIFDGNRIYVWIVVEYKEDGSSRVQGVYSDLLSAHTRKERLAKNTKNYIAVITKPVLGL